MPTLFQIFFYFKLQTIIGLIKAQLWTKAGCSLRLLLNFRQSEFSPDVFHQNHCYILLFCKKCFYNIIWDSFRYIHMLHQSQLMFWYGFIFYFTFMCLFSNVSARSPDLVFIFKDPGVSNITLYIYLWPGFCTSHKKISLFFAGIS